MTAVIFAAWEAEEVAGFSAFIVGGRQGRRVGNGGWVKKPVVSSSSLITSSLSLFHYHPLSADNPLCKALIDNSLFRTRESDKPYRVPVLKSLDSEFSLWPYWKMSQGILLRGEGFWEGGRVEAPGIGLPTKTTITLAESG